MRNKILKECLGMIDLTTLNTTDTFNKVESLVQKVNNFSQNFPGYPDVAAICVYPNFASAVKKSLTISWLNVIRDSESFESALA